MEKFNMRNIENKARKIIIRHDIDKDSELGKDLLELLSVVEAEGEKYRDTNSQLRELAFKLANSI